jgi:hypothetical protein
MPIQQVLVRHGRILRNLARLERLVAGERPTSVDRLADSRWAFTRDLLLHFAAMESRVYGPLMEEERAEGQAQAALASARTQALVRDFADHCVRWHGYPPAEQWDCYRRSIERLTAAVRERIDAEASEIVPLLPLRGGAGRPTPEGYAAEAWRIRAVIYTPAHVAVTENAAGFNGICCPGA